VEHAHEAANIPVAHAEANVGDAFDFDVITPGVVSEIFRTGMNRAIHIVNGFIDCNVEVQEERAANDYKKLLDEYPGHAELLMLMLGECVDVFQSSRLARAKAVLHRGLRGLFDMQDYSLRREAKSNLIDQASRALRLALEAEIPDRVLPEVMRVTKLERPFAEEAITEFIMSVTLTQDIDEINAENKRLRDEEAEGANP
jgi:hypothetical protein